VGVRCEEELLLSCITAATTVRVLVMRSAFLDNESERKDECMIHDVCLSNVLGYGPLSRLPWLSSSSFLLAILVYYVTVFDVDLVALMFALGPTCGAPGACASLEDISIE
jgi:hypothetical protein